MAAWPIESDWRKGFEIKVRNNELPSSNEAGIWWYPITEYRRSSQPLENGLWKPEQLGELLIDIKAYLPQCNTDTLNDAIKFIQNNLGNQGSYIWTRDELYLALWLLDVCLDKNKVSQDREKFINELKQRLKLICSIITGLLNKLPSIPDIYALQKKIRKDILWEETKKIHGMSNVEGRINSITSSLDPTSETLIIDILKAKIREWKPFIYNIFWGNPVHLLDTLSKEWILDARKYIHFIDPWSYRWISNQWQWTRDGRASFIDSDGNSVIVEPKLSRSESHEKLKWNEWNTANDLEWYLVWTDVRQSALIFQWGNIRQTSDTLFIGIDDILANLDIAKSNDFETSLSEWRANKNNIQSWEIDIIIKKFEEEFGKKVIIIGANNSWGKWNITHQLWYHIDLWVTPMWGKDLMLADSPSTNQIMINIKSDLESQWYKVYTLPTPSIALSYNNSLIERYFENGIEIKKVYLPQYSDTFDEGQYDLVLKADKQAKDTWENAWFEVIPIRVHTQNIKNQWSLNCRTNETRS